MENLMEEFKRKMFLDGKSEKTVEVYSNSVKAFQVVLWQLWKCGINLCRKSINSKLSALICFNELMETDNIVVSKRNLIKI